MRHTPVSVQALHIGWPRRALACSSTAPCPLSQSGAAASRPAPAVLALLAAITPGCGRPPQAVEREREHFLLAHTQRVRLGRVDRSEQQRVHCSPGTCPGVDLSGRVLCVHIAPAPACRQALLMSTCLM